MEMGRRTYRSQLEKAGADRVSLFSLWMRVREGGRTRVESKVKQVELSEKKVVALLAMKREGGNKEAPPPFSSASRIGSTRRVRRNDRNRNLLAGSGDQDGQNQGMMGVSEGQPLSHQGSPVRRLYPVPIEVSVREETETERVAPSTRLSGLLANSDRRRRPEKGVTAMVRENVGVRAHLGRTCPSLPPSSPRLTRSISSTLSLSLSRCC